MSHEVDAISGNGGASCSHWTTSPTFHLGEASSMPLSYKCATDSSEGSLSYSPYADMLRLCERMRLVKLGVVALVGRKLRTKESKHKARRTDRVRDPGDRAHQSHTKPSVHNRASTGS